MVIRSYRRGALKKDKAEELRKFEEHNGNSNFFNVEVLKKHDSKIRTLFNTKFGRTTEPALLSSYFCFNRWEFSY